MSEEKKEKKAPNLKCGGKCLKYFLALINIIFFIFGLAITGVAGYTAFDKNSSFHKMIAVFNNKALTDGLYILMAVGIFLALVAFLGIWGSISENRCILFMYLVFILLIFALQLAGIIVSFVEFKKVERKVIGILGQPASANKTTEALVRDVFVAALAAVQTRFHCCGITSPKNYGKNPLPASCFAPAPTLASGVTASSVAHGAQYTSGCVVTARPYLYAAGGMAIALLLLQIMIMLFTCCLINDIKKGYEAVA